MKSPSCKAPQAVVPLMVILQYLGNLPLKPYKSKASQRAFPRALKLLMWRGLFWAAFAYQLPIPPGAVVVVVEGEVVSM